MSGDHPDCEPIDVTVFGIVMDLIPLPENAPLSILSNALGNVSDVTLLQPDNAPLPIIFVPEYNDTPDLPTGTIISFVIAELYKHPPSDA